MTPQYIQSIKAQCLVGFFQENILLHRKEVLYVERSSWINYLNAFYSLLLNKWQQMNLMNHDSL